MADARAETTIVQHSAASERAIDWEHAYVLYALALLRYLRRLCGERMTAEDLMQETFERAATASTRLDPSGLRPWLYRIATNLGIDHLRRRRRVAFLPFSGAERDEAPIFDHDGELVRRALRAIPPEQAAALVLRLHERFSRAEIAAMTGVSERAVKDRLERGRESFARTYQRELGPR